MAEPRSQYPVGGNFTRTGEGGLVQGDGRHEEKVKVLLFHMANNATATVVARKPIARIHRTRGVVGIMSVCLLFVLSLSFPGAGPRSNREKEKKKKKKAHEKRLRQEAAGMPRLLSPVLEQTCWSCQGEKEEAQSPAGLGETAEAGSALLGQVKKGSSRLDLGITKAHNPSACM